MDFYGYSSEEEDGGGVYVLHNAAEAGDAELITTLLVKKPPEEVPPMPGCVDVPLMFIPQLHMEDDRPDVNLKDDDNCTPLHVAILNGRLEAMRVLLENGARVNSKCEGSPPLHMAVCVGSYPEHSAFSVPAIQLLVQHGAVPLDRDDGGRTPLHWAAVSGLVDAAEALLQAAAAFTALSAAAAAADLSAAPEEPLPTLPEFQDKQGNTALHLASRYRQGAMVQLLLAQQQLNSPSRTAAVKQRNKSGMNVLHLAALGGDCDCISAVVEACPAAAVSHTRQGLTAAALAARRGHVAATALLQGTLAPVGNSLPSSPRLAHHKPQHTLIVAPPECLGHHTAPWPILRGGPDPPPENVNRLVVITKPGVGILRTVDFAGELRWDERPRRAALGDILRVHDWAYIRKVQGVCDTIADDPAQVGHLDGDTAISHRSFSAALAAAGAVTHAVDEVVSGKARNVFCAVRPPGHHAGPGGVVTCANDPHGSHGFCLLNNVAIGAAYAMTVHRHAGIKRVAILDFDVHHGNGTEACVANTAPSLQKYAFSTPFGDGVQQFPVYRPWHDADDRDNVFFASVQGYGPKMPGVGAFVYPGSGATCDTRAVTADLKEMEEDDGAPPDGWATAASEATAVLAAADGTAAPMEVGGGEGGALEEDAAVHAASPAVHAVPSVNTVEEDPDQEFAYTGGEIPRTEGPRIIDVGIPGPGSRVALWRRAWRDKILPALVKFDADVIFISAGFDAHKKDEINFAYIGVQEKDYEWLTDEIVQVANRCCAGRVVSVLEGGYRIQGKVVSAFARSVAAHVRALADANGQEWDPRDARWEREHEKRLRAEAEARRLAAAQAAAAQAAAAQAAAAQAAAIAAQQADQTGGVAGEAAEGEEAVLIHNPTVPSIASPSAVVLAAATAAAAAAPPEEGEDDGGRRKRRRGAVDYVALNKKLEEEAAATAGSNGVGPSK